MLRNSIYITAVSSISSLGSSLEETWSNYQKTNHFLEKIEIGNGQSWVGRLGERNRQEIKNLRERDNKYKNLDKSVLYAIHAARKALENVGWNKKENFGINIGSSRGATALFEKYHDEFLSNGNSSTLASPTTTLGNISSWVAHDLKSKGPVISHSITCSTALHALLNGIAWIQGGLTDKFLVGGSEAPLTAFTLAQMQALKIYSAVDKGFPCRALDLEKRQNTMILGEGASIICIEKENNAKVLAEIVGIGYATEPLEHSASLSTDAQCFQESMRMAISGFDIDLIDAIAMHAPGTLKGDAAEFNAIKKVFGKKLPALTTNKWKLGHTFGASGMLSIEMAILMIQKQVFIDVPFYPQNKPEGLNYILVNAVGFGGNAVSILLKNPKSK